MNWTVEELALAYELRQAGCSFKRIAQGLGGDSKVLANRLSNIIAGGIHDPRVRVSDEALMIAHQMRTNSRLSWRAIGHYVGVEAGSLRSAYSRRVRHGACLCSRRLDNP